jgi:hypothetical protein
MNKFIPFLTVLTIIILSSAGCYTVLRHPAVEEDYSQSDYQVQCIDCHPDYHEYPYGYFYGDYPGYWWDSPRWGRYYAYPWWWDHYWFDNVRYHYDDYDDDGGLSPRSSSGKKVERRNTLRPPYTQGGTIIERSTTPASTGGVSGGSTGKQSGQSGQTKTKEKSTEQKEEKKAPRRGGGRPR